MKSFFVISAVIFLVYESNYVVKKLNMEIIYRNESNYLTDINVRR